MSPRRWYRSIYWRVALGLFAFLALMLAAEAAVFLWISDRMAGSMPARSPRRLAVLVSSDLGAALARDPNLDLERYVHDQYSQVVQTFFVLMRDGRVAANHDDVPSEVMAVMRSEAAAFPAGGGGRGIGARRRAAGQLTPRQELLEALPGPRPRGEVVPLLVDGTPAGRVVVWNGDRPFWRMVRQLGPTMGAVAAGVLLVGTALIAIVVFGPIRRRLKQVQGATERLGSGDLTARAPVDGGDEVAALAGSFNRMADELSARARALEASDRARRQLLADVSHELMTPLTAMRGYVETLTMPEVQIDAATHQRYMGIVMDETHRIEQIVGDLLDLARLEGGGMAMRRERVSMAALFERVRRRHERELSDRRVRLAMQVDAAAASIVGDPDRLEQALQNLAANALRHTPDDGEIVLTAERSGDDTLLTVRDNGPGIAPEHLPLIFDRFYKGDAARKAAGGSGLGLSIVKAIVERHGGTISARNQNGAVFEIRLPSTGADADERTAPARS